MAYARSIYIGRQDFSATAASCQFDWVKEGGANTCTINIPSAALDNFLNIDIGDTIDIRYGIGQSTRWWYGLVAEMTTDVNNGLTISGVGNKVRLGEIFPLGRYGTEVSMGTPSNLAALASETGGQLAAGTYTYRVSAVDDAGETLCSSTTGGTISGSTGKVDLTWDNLTAATGFRVYRGTADPFTYWETSENSFTDDGTSAGTSISAIPVSDTSNSPTIASAYVDDVITDLLSTYLPSDITVSSITGGSTFELDDYDLKDGSASLLDVLGALAEIVGPEISWGCDENGKVYFVAENETVTDTYYVGKDGQTTNVVTSISRRKSRDGVTSVRIEGNDELKDPQREIELKDRIGSTDDWPETRLISGAEWWKAGGNYKFSDSVPSTQSSIPEDVTTLTQAYASSSSYVTLVPELMTLKRMALTWNSGTNQYDVTPPFTSAIIVKHIQRINNRISYIRALRNAGVSDLENMNRRKTVVRYLPGVKTPALAKIAASNFTAKYSPVPDQWTITIEGLDTLLVPGVDLIRLYTQSGRHYDLSIQSASYTFESTVVGSLQCGDADFDEDKEKEENKKVLQKVVHREQTRGVWEPYRS